MGDRHMEQAETVRLHTRQIQDDGPAGNRVLRVDLQLLEATELEIDENCDDKRAAGAPSYYEYNASCGRGSAENTD